MNRWMGGVLVLLLGFSAVWGDDKPKEPDKPATPAEQYQALLKEDKAAMEAYTKAMREAKTPGERGKIQQEFQEKNPRVALVPKFLAFVEKYPKDPATVDALTWIVTNTSGPGQMSEIRTKALDILARDHVASDKIGKICQLMSFALDPASDRFLHAVMEKNKNADVRAEAALALAQITSQKAMIVKRLKDDPDLAKQLETALGKAVADEMKSADLAKLEAQSDQLFKEIADKHVAAMKPERIASLFQMLSMSGGNAGESLARSLLEKDTRPEVQGPACLTLAQMLKSRADETATTDPKSADKARQEAEKLFERAVEKFADVESGFRGTVGSVAKRELFDIRHLSVGKPAPDVEGEDQDGQKFKISDYKGKVVLLDFWSEF